MTSGSGPSSMVMAIGVRGRRRQARPVGPEETTARPQSRPADEQVVGHHRCRVPRATAPVVRSPWRRPRDAIRVSRAGTHWRARACVGDFSADGGRCGHRENCPRVGATWASHARPARCRRRSDRQVREQAVTLAKAVLTAESEMNRRRLRSARLEEAPHPPLIVILRTPRRPRRRSRRAPPQRLRCGCRGRGPAGTNPQALRVRALRSTAPRSLRGRCLRAIRHNPARGRGAMRSQTSSPSDRAIR